MDDGSRNAGSDLYVTYKVRMGQLRVIIKLATLEDVLRMIKYVVNHWVCLD